MNESINQSINQFGHRPTTFDTNAEGLQVHEKVRK